MTNTPNIPALEAAAKHLSKSYVVVPKEITLNAARAYASQQSAVGPDRTKDQPMYNGLDMPEEE